MYCHYIGIDRCLLIGRTHISMKSLAHAHVYLLTSSNLCLSVFSNAETGGVGASTVGL